MRSFAPARPHRLLTFSSQHPPSSKLPSARATLVSSVSSKSSSPRSPSTPTRSTPKRINRPSLLLSPTALAHHVLAAPKRSSFSARSSPLRLSTSPARRTDSTSPSRPPSPSPRPSPPRSPQDHLQYRLRTRDFRQRERWSTSLMLRGSIRCWSRRSRGVRRGRWRCLFSVQRSW